MSYAFRSHGILTYELVFIAGPDRVIPERILVCRSLNGQPRHLLGIGLLPGFIGLLIQIRLDGETRFGPRVPNQLDDHLMTGERTAPPIEADGGEHAMFYQVPSRLALRTSRNDVFASA